MLPKRGAMSFLQVTELLKRTIASTPRSIVVRTLATAVSDQNASTSSQRRGRNVRMLSPTVSEPEYAATVVHGRAIQEPIYHPRTHGVPVALLHLRSYNIRALDMFIHFASHAASSLGIPISRPVSLPTQRTLWTVPKGPFVHKKNQENFDRRTHKRVIKAFDATETVVTRWLQYIQAYPQPGVGMRVVRWYRAPLSIGQKHSDASSESQKETMRLENVTDRQRVEDLAKRIVTEEMAAAKLGSAPSKEILHKK